MKIFLGELDYIPEDAWSLIAKGDQIIIEQGMFKGQNAEILCEKKNTLLLNFEFMSQIIEVVLSMIHITKKTNQKTLKITLILKLINMYLFLGII
ncbi:MAG: hypothetical protein RIA69_18835 [Cyclobacteriaceae bacterium]